MNPYTILQNVWVVLKVAFALLVGAAAEMIVFAIFGSGFAHAQPTPTTRATSFEVLDFFQPKRNLQTLHDMGVRLHVGPEVESRQFLNPEAVARAEAEWYAEVGRLGDHAVAKNPPGVLPKCVVGVLIIYDEPNGKNIPALTVQANADSLRAAYPGVPVWLSLAGDKISSANFGRQWELDAFLAYAKTADVITVDVYSMNRNATRYLTSWTADVVRKAKLAAPSKKVVPWIEINDQQLDPPALPAFNRAPTADEITFEVEQALDAGADAFGWFSTCQRGKYGWGFPGDSYWPIVDRNKATLAPQLQRVATLSQKYAPFVIPLPPPEDPEKVALREEVASLKAKVQESDNRITVLLQGVAKTIELLQGISPDRQ